MVVWFPGILVAVRFWGLTVVSLVRFGWVCCFWSGYYVVGFLILFVCGCVDFVVVDLELVGWFSGGSLWLLVSGCG